MIVNDIVRSVLYILSIYVQSTLIYNLPYYVNWGDDFCTTDKKVQSRVLTQKNGLLCVSAIFVGLLINIIRRKVVSEDMSKKSSSFDQLALKGYFIIHIFVKGFYNTLFVQYALLIDIIFTFVHTRISRFISFVMTLPMLCAIGYVLVSYFNFTPEFLAEIVRDQTCDDGSNLYYLFSFIFFGYLINFINRLLGIN